SDPRTTAAANISRWRWIKTAKTHNRMKTVAYAIATFLLFLYRATYWLNAILCSRQQNSP
ncbi:MAG: hypothetical protein IKN41_01210, partial [Candidatus Methanomethylophilaceae archaeon]|nr:hypothetical protein [Candidatus Methanomethylophilaceae archaeon]